MLLAAVNGFHRFALACALRNSLRDMNRGESVDWIKKLGKQERKKGLVLDNHTRLSMRTLLRLEYL